MHATAKLDCVVVGYNDIDFTSRLGRLKASRLTSGGFDALHLQSLPYDGKRLPYMEVMNEALRIANRRDADLHIGKIPSLGSWYLWNYLVTNRYTSKVINFFDTQKEEFKQLLLTNPPRAVAITTTFYIDDAPIKNIANFVKTYSPKTKIIVGGPHVYNRFEEIQSNQVREHVLKNMGADIYIHESQGELTLSRILSHLRGEDEATTISCLAKNGKNETNSRATHTTETPVSTHSLHTIPNIAFYEGDKLITTPRSVESNDMDVYSIDWDKVDPKQFVPTATTRTGRSCAFACAFCRYPVIAGPLNLKSIDVVIRQFDQFERHGVKQVIIIDDTFNVPLNRFKELCKAIAARRYSFQWYSYLRPANLDAEALDLIAESGCGGCFMGIESGDPNILKGMNKAAKVDQYIKGVQGLNERNVTTFASLIVGFPGESTQTVDNTIAFIEEARPTYWRAGLYFHPKDAPISQKSEAHGISGHSYSWAHKTMNWQTGMAEIHRMLRTIEKSVYLPGYNFDLWGLPYLIGMGVSKQQHLAFNRMAQKLLLREMNGDLSTIAPDLENIANIFVNTAPD